MSQLLELPLAFGTPDDPPIIDPRDHMRRHKRQCRVGRVQLPRVGILTFSYMTDLLARAREQPGLREYPWFGQPLLDFTVRGRRVAVATLTAPGAPCAAAIIEELWALGFERLILVGGVGVLRDDLRRGSLIVPTAAIRDEGTSYHYLRPSLPATWGRAA